MAATEHQTSERGAGTDQYAAFAGRILRSYGRKALEGQLDPSALTQLAELRELLDAQLAETVTALRSEAGGSYSWAQVGQALGISREAACRKFGPSETAGRRPGGQPAELR